MKVVGMDGLKRYHGKVKELLGEKAETSHIHEWNSIKNRPVWTDYVDYASNTLSFRLLDPTYDEMGHQNGATTRITEVYAHRLSGQEISSNGSLTCGGKAVPTEETGTWTPDLSTNTVVFSNARYYRNGKFVFVTADIINDVRGNINIMIVSGWPFYMSRLISAVCIGIPDKTRTDGLHPWYSVVDFTISPKNTYDGGYFISILYETN